MSGPLDMLGDAEREALEKSRPPAEPKAMLATLTDERFDDPDWIYERKLDGERVLIRRVDGKVKILSRNAKQLNATYPELVEALEGRGPDIVVDGEVVAFKDGVSSFRRLQKRMQKRTAEEARQSGVAIYCYLFDILYCDGYSVEKLPLIRRKAILKRALDFGSTRVRYTPHRTKDGVAYWKAACRKGWEGVIAKRADSPYRHSRSRDWLKFKCVNQQELVIGGYTEPQGERIGFGALLLGYYEGDKLRYAGMVGTGFDDDLLRSLSKDLRKRQTDESPFADEVKDSRDIHWVNPALVGEVGFTEWTDDGKLRHPRFLGLRRDKKPKDVVRETSA